MKNKIIFLTLSTVLILMGSCKDEELRVKYAESYPTFDKCVVLEDSITYGDSITLDVELSDSKTPLSTMQIKVVVNDEIIASEVIRTKGNNSTYTNKYHIPFQPRMPHMAEVEVHLKSINVEGFETDTIIFNTKAHRILFPKIWFVTSSRTTTQEMTVRMDSTVPYLYEAYGEWGNTVSFRLATKVTSTTKKVDWTGFVLGTVDGHINFIDGIEDEWITVTDPTLFKIKKVIIDLYNLTAKAEGEPLVPATAINIADFASEPLISVNNLGVGTARNFKTNNMYLGKDVEITFDGITFTDKYTLNPDFFEITGANTAKFLGETNIYKVYYLAERNYLTVEIPAAVYPQALWLVGVGMGWPVAPLTKSTSWNWTTPEEYIYCRKISEGVFQSTIFINHESDNAYGDNYWRYQFSTKYFYQRGWGSNDDKTLNEADANKYTLPSLLKAQKDGNWGASDSFLDQPGVYRLVTDVINKTTTITKLD